jgi:hypothetical protein
MTAQGFFLCGYFWGRVFFSFSNRMIEEKKEIDDLAYKMCKEIKAQIELAKERKEEEEKKKVQRSIR